MGGTNVGTRAWTLPSGDVSWRPIRQPVVLEDWPVADGEFTAVLCTASFHHYPDPHRALAEMARVLEPGGRVVIGDGTSDLLAARLADGILRRVDRSHVRLDRTAELRALLAGAGFGDVDVRTTMGGGWAIASARR